MKRDILISTTTSIENCPVKQYKGLVSTNIVLGANVISDIKASFTDFFGGASNTYQRKLELMYKTAVENLKSEAQKINANAIIGAKIDFDEISGSGKSMFMLSAVGTAVVVDTIKPIDDSKVESILGADLEVKIQQMQYMRDFTPATLITNEQWDFLFEHPVDEIADILIPQCHNYKATFVGDSDYYFTKTKTYFRVINREYAEKLLYSKIIEFPATVVEIMRDAELFSPQRTYDLLTTGDRDAALASCSANKSLYDRNDLGTMQKILSFLQESNDRAGHIEKKKGGMLSKEKEVFVCHNGHENNADIEFCSTCGINIDGWSKEEKAIVDKLTNLDQGFIAGIVLTT